MRTKRFTFICSAVEKQAITMLAQIHRRSQSDLIRYLIYQAILALPDTNTRTEVMKSLGITQIELKMRLEEK
jgi:diketogulonate reductase-like aldo/keto reductase